MDSMTTKVRVGEKKNKSLRNSYWVTYIISPLLVFERDRSRCLQLDRCRIHGFNLTSTFLAGLRRRGPSPDRRFDSSSGNKESFCDYFSPFMILNIHAEKRVDFFLFLVKISRAMIIVVTNAVKQVNDEVDEM